MTSNFRTSLLFRAAVISVNLNALMILLGTIGNMVKALSILAKVANFIAAPVGFLVGWLIHPTGQSLVGIVVAAMEGMIASFVFYTLLAWIVLWFLANRGPKKNRSDHA